MWKVAGSFVLFAAFAGCAVAPQPQISGAGLSCVPLDQLAGKRVSGPAAIDFEMIDGSVHRNQLASACPGLNRNGNLAVVSVSSGGEGGRLCRGDRVRVFDPVEARATGVQSYPECVLGDFSKVAQR